MFGLGKSNLPVPQIFENGMRLFSIANEMVFASQVGFNFGSRNDLLSFSGMAHFNEHLACRGASPKACAAALPASRPPLISERRTNRMMRKFLGGSNGDNMNVYTMTSHTGYGHQDLFDPKYLGHVFPVVVGNVRDYMYDVRVMRHRDEAIVTHRAFAIERNAVANEVTENNEWPGMIGYREALKLLYRSNPVRFYGDADLEQLDRVKPGTVKLWAQGHYVPANMTVVMFGPDHNSAVRLIRAAGLNKIPAWEPTRWAYDHADDVPVLTEKVHHEIRRPGSLMRHVCILWPTEVAFGEYDHELEVLGDVLKDRVEADLRDDTMERGGGVYHPLAEWDSTSSHGFLTVQFSTRGNDAHCDELIARTLAVVKRLLADRSEEFAQDVEDARFFRARAHVEQYLFIPGKSCDRMVYAVANGDRDLSRFIAYHDTMMGVTPTRVRNAAKKYLKPDRFVMTVVRPAE